METVDDNTSTERHQTSHRRSRGCFWGIWPIGGLIVWFEAEVVANSVMPWCDSDFAWMMCLSAS